MKKILLTVCLFLFIFSISAAFAQDKVVVVPLSSSNKSGAAFDSADGAAGSIPLSNTPLVIRSVTVKLPGAGIIVANASGYMDLNYDETSWAACSITRDSLDMDIDQLYMVFGVGHPDEIPVGFNMRTARYVPFAGTKSFTATESGETTIRLICREYGGTTDVNDTNLTVMYFPNDLQ